MIVIPTGVLAAKPRLVRSRPVPRIATLRTCASAMSIVTVESWMTMSVVAVGTTPEDHVDGVFQKPLRATVTWAEAAPALSTSATSRRE